MPAVSEICVRHARHCHSRPSSATIRWKKRKVFVTTLLKRHYIGLEQIGDGVWSVYYGPVHLGRLDEADFRIMDVKERARRRR